MGQVYLADTQIVIWSIVSPSKIIPSVQAILQENTILVSDISLFEIVIKQKIGRLPDLTMPIDELTTQLLVDGFKLLPVERSHIAAYEKIPLYEEHRDPFDRLLLATALAEAIPVISADKNFRLYTSQIQLVEA